jgi:hypothetical protein
MPLASTSSPMIGLIGALSVPAHTKNPRIAQGQVHHVCRSWWIPAAKHGEADIAAGAGTPRPYQ